MLRAEKFNAKYPIKPLGEVVDFLDNLRKPIKASDRVDGEYPYYGANGLQGFINDFIFDEPLVLLAEDGGHFGNPEKTIAYIAEGKYWVNNHAHVLKPKDGLDLKFLCRVLENYDVSPFIKGATRAKLTKGDAFTIPIPFPSFAEQKRIAAILDKADSLRRKNQQAIQLADQFLRAVFLDMFGDPVTNPKGWQKEPLANHFKIGTGGTPSRAIQENYGGNIPWVKTTEVCGRLILETGEALTERGLADSNCKVYPIGSLIIAMYGQGKTRGQCGILGLEASTNQACAVLEPSETLEMNFVYQYIKYSYDQLRELSRGGNQPNLNLSLVKSFEVMIPDKKLQIHFSNIFLRVQEILKQSNDFKDDNLFNSLSQKAFAGEL